MHQGLYFAGFALVSALCFAAAKWLDDDARRRAMRERGRSSFPPRMSMPGDSRPPSGRRSSAPPLPDDGRSSGH